MGERGTSRKAKQKDWDYMEQMDAENQSLKATISTLKAEIADLKHDIGNALKDVGLHMDENERLRARVVDVGHFIKEARQCLCEMELVGSVDEHLKLRDRAFDLTTEALDLARALQEDKDNE